MFFPPNQQQQSARPFLLGMVLLMLFLTMQSEWSGPAPRGGMAARSAPRTGELKEGIKERIIYDVSIANEKMSQELQQLKQYVLDLRREARACGCELNSSRVLTLFPELHTLINDTSTKQANSIGSGSKQANSSGSQEGSPGAAGGSAQAAKEGDVVANTAAQQQA